MIKCLLVIFLFAGSDSYNILGIFGHPGRSHFFMFQPLLEGLAEKGHELTILGHFPKDRDLPTYHDISLPKETLTVPTLDHNWSRWERYTCLNDLAEWARLNCDSAMASVEYKKLLNSTVKYDVIISEFFNTNCLLLPIVEKFKIPFIGISAHVLMDSANEWVGNPHSPAYTNQVCMGFNVVKSFWERVESSLLWIYLHLYQQYGLERMEYALIKKHLGKDELCFKNVMYNTSLILVATHFSLHKPKPAVSNVIEIGGVHIRKLRKLPTHLEKWINESTHGVVYFSLGSMIKGHTFPDEKKQMFLNAFKRIPQRVLWKWENETMPGKPDNVMIDKWMPQLDVLCHPNVKGFISHGGLLGATEGVHCGVPMIIMPQFGDQFTNAKAVETSGGGVIVDYRNLDEESIYEALTTILSPDFNKEVKELSARFKDRPLPPLETAIYWVEYVARHRGAPHLKTAAVGMPLYQYLLLDVIAFLAVILFSFIFIIYYITRALFRRLCKSGKASAKLKKN